MNVHGEGSDNTYKLLDANESKFEYNIYNSEKKREINR